MQEQENKLVSLGKKLTDGGKDHDIGYEAPEIISI